MSEIVTVSDKIKFYERIFGNGKLDSQGKNFVVCCPICDPKDRTKKKLAILVENDGNHCWVCGWKSRTLAPLIVRYGTKDQLREYRTRFMSEESKKNFDRYRQNQNEEGETKEPERLVLPEDFQLLAIANSGNHDVISMLRYLRSRDVTEKDLWYYKLGYSSEYRWSRRVIMPSFDASGELNYFTGRAVDVQKQSKYDAPSLDRKTVIFNEINLDWSQRLVICEGPFDLMKCGENAVPLLGSDLNPHSSLFCNIVLNRTPVALALDANMKKKTWRYAKFLSTYDLEVSIVEVPDDPGEMSKEEFSEALADAVVYDDKKAFEVRLDEIRSTNLRL